MKYDICVPFCGPGNYIRDCINSIRAYSEDYRIILFCNGAPKEIRDEAKGAIADIPHVFLESETVLPIIKPHNAMLAYSTAPFKVIMNDDTEVSKDWLTNVSRCFENPKVRIAAPLINEGKNSVNHNSFWFKGPCRDEVLYDVPFVDCQCLMLTTQTVKDLGYYSEEMHYRFDTEYGLRCKARGYEIAIDLRTVIVHKSGGSANAVDPQVASKCCEDLNILTPRYPHYVPLWDPR